MAKLVSRRYANALFDAAFESKSYEKVEDELNFILKSLKGEPQFYQLFKSPLITVEEKKEMITTIFKKNISEQVYNLLLILVEKRREEHIKDIINEYIALVDEVKNKVNAVAITAVPIEKKDLLKLKENLSKSSEKDVQLQNYVDPDVVGGILIRIGDKVIDGTIKSRIVQMREQLSQILV